MEGVILRLDSFLSYFKKKKKVTDFFLSVTGLRKEIFSPQLSFSFNNVIHCKAGMRRIHV